MGWAFVGRVVVGIIISAIGGVVSRALQKPAQIEGPRIDGLDATTSAYGLPIPKIYGCARRAGNVIWQTDIKEVRSKSSSGGKKGGGGGKAEITTYSYYCTFAVAICQGPIAQVRRIWCNNKLKYDASEGSTVQYGETPYGCSCFVPTAAGGVMPSMGTKIGESIQVYYGTEDQEPDPVIEAYEGIGNVNANRGLAYVVFENIKLEYGRIDNYEFEIVMAGNEILTSDKTTSAGVMFVDRIVVHHNGHFLFVVDPADSTYKKIDTLGNQLILERTIPEANALECPYDVDEFGVLYVFSKQDWVYFGVLRIDTVNLGVITSSAKNMTLPILLRVVRNPNASYLYAAYDYDNVRLYDRDTCVSLGGWVTPETIRSIALNHTTGEAWVLYSHRTDYDQVGVYHIDPASGIGIECSLTSDMDDARFITYCDATNQVIVGGEVVGRIGFYDAADMTLNGYLVGNYVGTYNYSNFQQGPVNGFLFTIRNEYIYKINTANRVVNKTYGTVPVSVGTTYSSIYDPIINCAWVQSSTGLHRVYLDRGIPARIPLEEVVEDICGEIDLGSAEIDTTDLISDNVTGYRIDGRMSARAALQPLMDTYLFDAVESDGKIKFVKRGGSAAVNIPEDELGAYTYGADRPQELTLTRGQEVDLPKSIEISYADFNADYQAGVQRTQRINVNATGALNYRLPMTLSADEVKQLAEITMGEKWIERTRASAFIPNKYAYLEPTDIVNITRGSETHRLFVADIRRGDGLLELQCNVDDADIYTSNASGTTQTLPDTVINYPGTTTFYMIDCPALDDTFNRSGIYCAAAGYTSSWHGAQLYRSLDAGQTFVTFDSVTETSIVGSTDSALGDHTEGNVIDWDNSLTVTLLDDSAALSSCTELQLLNGANACMIGDEIVKFMTVTDDGSSKWTLSGLLRGRRGTNWAISTHEKVERFILFDSGKTIFSNLPLSDLANSRTYGAISYGMDVNTGTRRVITTELRTLKPYSPAAFTFTVDGSKNIDLAWIRRTRIGGAWNDYVDVPLSENSEEYEVDVIVPTTGVVQRTLESIVENVQYTRALQLTDFSATDAVQFKVYQISDDVGRGWATTLDTTIPA